MMTNNLYTVNHHFVTYSLLKSINEGNGFPS